MRFAPQESSHFLLDGASNGLTDVTRTGYGRARVTIA